MKNKDWKGIAELIGIAAIVVSLIFVGLQLRQEQEIAIVETRGDVTATIIGLADVLKGNGDIWKKGLDGAPLTDAERIEFLALVRVVESQLFTLWARWSRLGPEDPDLAAQEYAYALYSHPGLRSAHETSRKYSQERNETFGRVTFGNGFYDLVDRHLAKLDSANPPIIEEKSYIFW